MAKRLTVGQKIVHRRYGAGIIVELRGGKEDEEHESYYVIDIPSVALKVHFPVSADQGSSLRRISSKRTMRRALSVLSAEPHPLPKDYRERRALMQQSMSNGAVSDIAQVIRDLCGLRAVKKNKSTMELAMMTNAKRRLAGELALVSDIDFPEALQCIEDALQKNRED